MENLDINLRVQANVDTFWDHAQTGRVYVNDVLMWRGPVETHDWHRKELSYEQKCEQAVGNFLSALARLLDSGDD